MQRKKVFYSRPLCTQKRKSDIFVFGIHKGLTFQGTWTESLDLPSELENHGNVPHTLYLPTQIKLQKRRIVRGPSATFLIFHEEPKVLHEKLRKPPEHNSSFFKLLFAYTRRKKKFDVMCSNNATLIWTLCLAFQVLDKSKLSHKFSPGIEVKHFFLANTFHFEPKLAFFEAL